MTVRKRKWRNAAGREMEAWVVDVQIQMPGGALHRVRETSPVNTRRGAEEFERQLRESILRGTYGKAQTSEQTFDDFAPKFLDWSTTHNKASSAFAKRSIVREHLSPFFGSMPLGAIRAGAVEEFKAKVLGQKPKPSNKTVNNWLTVLRKLLRLAAEWELIDSVPHIRTLKVAEAPYRFASIEELPVLLNAVESTWRPMVETAALTGLRIGELLALRWEDVDLQAGRLVVRRNLWRNVEDVPKGGRTREVPLSDRALVVLKGHRHLRGPYVFCSEDGSRLTANMVKRVVTTASRKAGLGRELGWHDMRDTFASHLVMRGASLKAVQELLGHQSINQTMKYSHLEPRVRRETVRLLDGT